MEAKRTEYIQEIDFENLKIWFLNWIWKFRKIS